MTQVAINAMAVPVFFILCKSIAAHQDQQRLEYTDLLLFAFGINAALALSKAIVVAAS